MDKIRDINEDILNQKLEVLVQKLVFGASKPSKFEILNSSIEYFLVNKRFDVPLLWNDSLLKVFLCSCLSIYIYIYIYIYCRVTFFLSATRQVKMVPEDYKF